MNKIIQAWDTTINGMASMFKTFAFAIIFTLAPLIAPLAPAMLFGYNFYQALPESEYRLIPAIAAAIALEAAGFISSKVAIHFYSKRDEGKMWIAITVCTLYLLVGISSVFLETSSSEIKFLTVVVFITTGLIYIAIALWEDHQQAEMSLKKSERIDNAVALKRVEIELDEQKKDAEHKRKLAAKRLELAHEVKMMRATSPSPPPVETEKLTESFPKVSVSETQKVPSHSSDWRKLSSDDMSQIPVLSVLEITEKHGVTARTARNWQANWEKKASK